MIAVHKVREWTEIPKDLMDSCGFQRDMLTEDLCWVAEDWESGECVGILVAFAAHKFFYPIRVVVVPGAPKSTALALLRRSLVDARKDGYQFFLTHLENTSVGEKLARILEGHDGIPVRGGWYGGFIDNMLAKTLPKSHASGAVWH